jgi:formylglycine-generating enzyme required for sulfatase activity
MPEGKIDIIPVQIDSCDPPPLLQHPSLPHLFGANLFEAGGFEKLVAAVRARMAMRPNPELERRARRQVPRLLWLGLSLLVALELTLATLTWHYGWEIMESWAHFLGVLPLLSMYGYFVYTTHEFSPRIFYEQLVAARLAKIIEAGTLPHTFTNSIGMELILIPNGEFRMGSPDSDADARDSEKPARWVTISQPFYLGKYPVTQSQWQAVMGENQSRFKGDHLPVETVSWNDVQGFMQKLSEQEGRYYRLPTEAEWEYACRAGSTTRYSFSDDAAQLCEYAWYNGNAGDTPHPVGEKKPNTWGLYDMHGNVWEWVQDLYERSPRDRVNRGGSWFNSARHCRSAVRGHLTPNHRAHDTGFRCAMSVPSQ